ncbi:hypothetical protein [Actinomadura madurae]|nr:hypothetical protein [Actinomadura madurae]
MHLVGDDEAAARRTSSAIAPSVGVGWVNTPSDEKTLSAMNALTPCP